VLLVWLSTNIFFEKTLDTTVEVDLLYKSVTVLRANTAMKYIVENFTDSHRLFFVDGWTTVYSFHIG
jgi:hypothetical protein